MISDTSKKTSVLVVDDDPFMTQVLYETLVANGYLVDTAGNGSIALEKYASNPGLDLIILAIDMPVMGGIETVKRLRGNGSNIPIIVLMTNSQINRALEAISLGANDYLLNDKNTQDMIVLLVERVLEKKRLQDQNNQLLSDVNRLLGNLESIVSKLTEIGAALSSEKDFQKLLEKIVSHARAITQADAGTLYLTENGLLNFAIIQNGSLKIQMGGRSDKKIPFAPFNIIETNAAGFASLTGLPVNIPDIYNSDVFDFSVQKRFDLIMGYRSKSMVVLPMKNHENEVVGVLELMNAKDIGTGEVIPFSKESERLGEAIASQAAVAVTNVILANGMEKLFDSFVEVMATAIDEKSPVTGGHIRRMTDLSMALAEEINAQTEGRFKGVTFNQKQLYQLKIAALMHDIGKVTTPTEIMEKGKKLEAIFDRVHHVQLRLRYIAKLVMINGYKKRLSLVDAGAGSAELLALDDEIKQKTGELEDISAFILRCNEPGEFLEDQKLLRLQDISKMTYLDDDGKALRYLTDNELENLSIRKGSITEKERKKMQDHAVVTVKMLKKIPFPKNLKDVPRIAGTHHECINGKGYPLGLKEDEIPFEGRLLAVADIAEALTASDRPYKKAMPLETAFRILRDMAGKGDLDPHLVELLVENKVYEKRFGLLPAEEATPKAPEEDFISFTSLNTPVVTELNSKVGETVRRS